jgi:hypothetical protein
MCPIYHLPQTVDPHLDKKILRLENAGLRPPVLKSKGCRYIEGALRIKPASASSTLELDKGSGKLLTAVQEMLQQLSVAGTRSSTA